MMNGTPGVVSAPSVNQSGAAAPGGDSVDPSHAYSPCGDPNRTPPCWPAVLPKNCGRQTFAQAQ